MYCSNTREFQYLLPLDCLDKALIYKCLEKRDEGHRLLWSTSYMDGETTYYQVELQCNDDEDSYCKPVETFMCHTCSMDVPQIYVKEHLNSEKHQNLRKLTEKVLENVSRQINVFVNNTQNYIDDDLYYCESCSKAVLRKQEREHKLSNYHINSVENDKITHKFLDFYIQNQDNEIKNEAKIQSYDEVKYDCDDLSLPDSTESVSNNNNSISTINNSDIQQIGKEIQTKGEVETVCDVDPKQTYNKDCPGNVHTKSNIESIDHKDNVFYFKASNVMTDEDAKFCDVCKEIRQDEDIDTHVKGVKHCFMMSLIGICKILEENIEEIKSYNTDSKQLPNQAYELIKDKLIKEANAVIKLLEENKFKMISFGEYHCALCNKDVGDFFNHLQLDIEHVKNKLVCSDIDVEKLKLYVYNGGKDLVLKQAYNIVYNELLHENKIKKLPNSYYCCEICNMWVKETFEINHMFSDSHKARKEYFWQKQN